MASKMSSNSPSNGGASTHGAIPKDTQAAMSSNDSGQNYEPPDIDPVTLKVSGMLNINNAYVYQQDLGTCHLTGC